MRWFGETIVSMVLECAYPLEYRRLEGPKIWVVFTLDERAIFQGVIIFSGRHHATLLM